MFYTHTHTEQMSGRRKRTGLVLLPLLTPDVKGGQRRSLSFDGRAD